MSRAKQHTVEEAMTYLLSRSLNQEVSVRLPVVAKFVQTHRNELGRCPFCTQKIDDVMRPYTKETAVDVLRIIYDWCVTNNRHEFRAREIKHLLNHTQYASLNHLDRFAGIIYRPINKATGERYSAQYYGINKERADGFFLGMIQGPLEITSNRLTKERIVTKTGYIHEFPSILSLMDEEETYHNPELEGV